MNKNRINKYLLILLVSVLFIIMLNLTSFSQPNESGSVFIYIKNDTSGYATYEIYVDGMYMGKTLRSGRLPIPIILSAENHVFKAIAANSSSKKGTTSQMIYPGRNSVYIFVQDTSSNGNVSNYDQKKGEIVAFDIIPYKIGSKGPAGGWIFYDKGKYTNGWQYLEAAPASTEWNYKERSNCRKLIRGTEMGIGTGKNNTDIIVETDRVAQLCDALVYGGYADWFLPSLYELDLMYENLHLKGVGGFADIGYCSSSGDDHGSIRGIAWALYFDGGDHYWIFNDKGGMYRVRAVRAF